MRNASNQYLRILGIDPTSRGFGFAVLEARGRLVDWGLAGLYSQKDDEFVVRLDALVDKYRPAIIALEDPKETRRGERWLRRFDRAVGYAEIRQIRPLLVSRNELRAGLGLSATGTKQQIAEALAKHFPELEPLLPPPRKPWQNESQQLAVFRAVGLAMTVLGRP